MAAQNLLARISSAWVNLATREQRDGWSVYAAANGGKRTFGGTRLMRGQDIFTRFNTVILMGGVAPDPILTPPPARTMMAAPIIYPPTNYSAGDNVLHLRYGPGSTTPDQTTFAIAISNPVKIARTGNTLGTRFAYGETFGGGISPPTYTDLDVANPYAIPLIVGGVYRVTITGACINGEVSLQTVYDRNVVA